MKCTNATKFHRKSGGAKWRDLLFAPPATISHESTAVPFVIPRDLQFRGPFLEMFCKKKPELAKANSGNSGLLYRDGNLNRLIRSSMAGLFVGTYGLSAEATGLGKLSRLRVVTAGTAQFASMNFRIET